MKEIGKKINRMGLGKKVGLMGLHMKGIINKEKKVDKENSNGLMGVPMMVNLRIIILMEKGFIHGEIKDNILEIGKIIKWMDMEFLLGLMGEDIKEIIKMIKKMDMVFLSGLMEKNIKDIGKMESKMEKENSIMTKLKLGENALFKMEEELNGLMNKKIIMICLLYDNYFI